MRKFMKPIGRLLAVLALVALVQSPGSSVIGSDAGRDFARCIDQCNAVKRACDDQCSVDCKALFPNDLVAQDACIQSCRDECNSDKEICKHQCNVHRPPITPEEP